MKNEALAKLDGLVGEWDLMMTDAWFLDSPDIEVRGKAKVEWLGDAFLYLSSTWEDDSTISRVIGRSDPHDRLTVIAHDSRGGPPRLSHDVRRRRAAHGACRSGLHQRIVGTVTADRIDARTQASEDEGKTWRKDFDLIFERRTG